VVVRVAQQAAEEARTELATYRERVRKIMSERDAFIAKLQARIKALQDEAAAEAAAPGAKKPMPSALEVLRLDPSLRSLEEQMLHYAQARARVCVCLRGAC
jgi:hypothetical protein